VPPGQGAGITIVPSGWSARNAVDGHAVSLAQGWHDGEASPNTRLSDTRAGLTMPCARRNGVRDVGSLLPDVGGVAFKRFGFVQGSACWAGGAEIVGPVYARWSVPDSLRFPRGRKRRAL
jgi:hypothetical protein